MYASIPDQFVEEQAFIRELWFEPGDISARLIYADWLDENGSARAAILRNDVEFIDLSSRGLSEAEATVARERLVQQRRKLIKPEYREWIALIGSCQIDNCGAVWMSRIQTEELDIRCPKRWENLPPLGDDAKVRVCQQCQRSVHYCWSMEDAHRHTRAGNGVAVDPSVARDRAYLYEHEYYRDGERDYNADDMLDDG